MRFGKPLTWEYWRLWLCEKFGWSLTDVDQLSFEEAFDIIDIWTSAEKAKADDARKASKHASKGKRRA